jgi:hypothetical protein
MNVNFQNFRQPIVNKHDEHLNYGNNLNNVNNQRAPLFYGSELFSGTTLEENKADIRLIEYQNGLLEGKNALYANGVLISEVFYTGGYEMKGKTWYEHGILESAWDNLGSKYWSNNGQLVFEKNTDTEDEGTEERWYFGDGKLKYWKTSNLHICTQGYFAPDGEWLLTHKFLYDYSPMRDEALYNEQALFKWYFEILNYETTEGEEKYSAESQQRMNLIWIWFWEVRKNDKNKFMEIFAKLMLHPQPKVVRDLINIVAYHRLIKELENYYLAQNQAITENPLAEVFASIEAEQKRLDEISPNRVIQQS